MQIQIFEKLLTDGSRVYGVPVAHDGQVIVFDAYDESAAHNLAEGIGQMVNEFSSNVAAVVSTCY